MYAKTRCYSTGDPLIAKNVVKLSGVIISEVYHPCLLRDLSRQSPSRRLVMCRARVTWDTTAHYSFIDRKGTSHMVKSHHIKAAHGNAHAHTTPTKAA